MCQKEHQHHLHIHGFKRRVVVVKKENRAKCMSWSRKKVVAGSWTLEQFFFSDECRVVIVDDNRMYVWRELREGYRPDLLPGRGWYKVMMWACICRNGVET